MKTTVALCTYNGAQFLREQLESLVAQTRRPDELVVVDDCSSDETVEIINAFSNTCPFEVRLFENEQNLGFVRNFERSLSLATGDVVFPCDQDDVWLPEKIAVLSARLEADESVALVASNATPVDEQLKPLGTGDFWRSLGISKERLAAMRTGRAFEVLLLQGNVFAGMSMAIRRRFLEDALPIAPEWYHDSWLALAAASRDALLVEEKPLVLYRIHGRNSVGINRTPWTELLRGFFRLDAKLLLSTAKQLETACDRFGTNIDPERLSRLAERAQHLRFRATLPGSRLFRAPLILREALSGRYGRYSWGPIAVLRDVVRSA